MFADSNAIGLLWMKVESRFDCSDVLAISRVSCIMSAGIDIWFGIFLLIF
jgi:hypothetical protein